MVYECIGWEERQQFEAAHPEYRSYCCIVTPWAVDGKNALRWLYFSDKDAAVAAASLLDATLYTPLTTSTGEYRWDL